MARKKKETRGGAGRNQGRRADDGAVGLKRYNVTLDDGSVANAIKRGDGNMSVGIRRALAQKSRKESHEN